MVGGELRVLSKAALRSSRGFGWVRKVSARGCIWGFRV